MKKFNCQEVPTDTISAEHSSTSKRILFEINYFDEKEFLTVALSKTDAIEFCREIMKQISLLE